MNLGELSTLVVWGATTTYAIAFLAFAVDLARRAEVRTPVPAVAGRRVAATVGASSGEGTSGDAGTAGETPSADVPDDRTGYRPGKALGIAMSLTTLGLGLQVVGVVLRGVAAERVPWANLYEFLVVGTLVAVATFRLLCLKRDLRFLGALVLGLSVVALGLGLTAFYLPAMAVEPALQSYWLVIHVTIAVIATGVFVVAVSLSVLQLVKDAWEAGSPRLSHPRLRLLANLPSVTALEALAFRLNAVGFVLWTFTVMAGAVWAEHAWSRFWGWDPKEVWSFIVWVVYAAYLHARTTRGWSGRAVAWFSVVGFAVLVFNLTGVNLLLGGKHTYAGVE